MWVKGLNDCREIVAGDGSLLREIFNPLREPLGLGYSLAWARVGPGRETVWHRLRSAEVYVLLRGDGEMFIDEERKPVGEGQTVFIPPGSRQRIRNTGPGDLEFLCLVEPAWRPEDEQIEA